MFEKLFHGVACAAIAAALYLHLPWCEMLEVLAYAALAVFLLAEALQIALAKFEELLDQSYPAAKDLRSWLAVPETPPHDLRFWLES